MSHQPNAYDYPPRNTHDPYRAVRKTPSPVHSRTASDSSTSRLASASQPNNTTYSQGYDDNIYQQTYSNNPYHEEDPYAVAARHHQGEKKRNRKRDNPDQRANSYLPYSHHRHDPYAPSEPIYLEEDPLPSFNSPGKDGTVGSILQDNIAMDMVDHNPPRSTGRIKNMQHLEPLPEIKRKRRRLCGLPGRTVLFIAFGFMIVVGVIWYFVWPRTPTLHLLDAGLLEPSNNFNVNGTIYQMDSSWRINMTVDNSDNWVPTRVNTLSFKIFDSTTGRAFGEGSSGFRVFPARTQSQVSFPMTISYKAWSEADVTWQNLYTACGPQKQNPMPEEQASLNVRFEVTWHIAGMVKTRVATVIPSNGFACPTD
ncbi:hypothetical protein J3Q64DRAFT_1712467 [Phycomyces blakesleeanus]|uniref:Late embryogenesis abundant protein LEA-2 subgroup domain-containing protein n=1 Tax=Phycomyces blakesleeanus TaxID=4837 RepID=A0ABR3BEJ8_PHYBL